MPSDGIANASAVQIFKRSGPGTTDWTLQQSLVSLGTDADFRFGTSVATDDSGDVVAADGPGLLRVMRPG